MTSDNEFNETTDAEGSVAVEEIIEEIVVDAETGEVVAEVEIEIDEFDEDEEDFGPRTESPYDRPGRWYVVHTYSGYENKVKGNLENVITSRAMEDTVFEIVIPMEDVVEFKNGKKVTVSKKVFPGYILVRMFLDEDNWSAVRGTPGVTGFVGSGTKPVPLSRKEVENILHVEIIGGEQAPANTSLARPCASRKARSQISQARSTRSTKTSSSSRCWSTFSVERLRSNSNSVRSQSSRNRILRFLETQHIRRKKRNTKWPPRRFSPL